MDLLLVLLFLLSFQHKGIIQDQLFPTILITCMLHAFVFISGS